MPKFPAYSHLPLYNAPMQVAITYPSIRETSGLTTELPASEPETAQVSYTVQASDLPICTPKMPFAFAPMIYLQGQNLSGTSRSISYRTLLNGTSLYTTNIGTATNNQYWGISSALYCAFGAAPPVVGDVLTVKMWSNGGGVQMNAHALVPYLSRPLYGTKQVVLWRDYGGSNAIAREASARKPTWMAATPFTGAAGNNVLYIGPIGTSTFTSIALTQVVPAAWSVNPTFGLCRSAYSDYLAVGSGIAASAAAVSYSADLGITLLTYLPLNIKI